MLSERSGRVRGAALAVVFLVAIVGCRVDTTLTIDVRDDGSGVVRVRTTLDADAVRQSEAGGATLEDRVRLGDLTAAGWTVSPWQRKPDGSATIVIRKSFGSEEQLAQVVEELNGARGPVRDVRLQRDAGLLTTSFDVSGAVDLAELTSGVLDDPEIVARLSAERVDLPAVDQRLTQQLRDSFRLEVVVRFPDGSSKTIAVEPGTRKQIDASSSDLDATRAGLLGVAVVLVALAAVILVRGERMRAHRHHR